MHSNSTEHGFVTLASVMMLLAVAVAAALVAFLAAWQSVDGQASWRSWVRAQHAADACVETARARLWQNPAYTGNETLALPTGRCDISDVTVATASWQVSGTGYDGAAVARTFVEFNLTVASPSGSVEALDVVQYRRVVGF